MTSFLEEYPTILTLIYGIGILPQLILWGIIIPLSLWKKRVKPSTYTPNVSVIIAAKNEEAQLPKLLASLVKQKYPQYEIVVINDRSTDNTSSIIDVFQSKYTFIKKVEITSLEKGWSPKKFALTQGLKSATYNKLLFIDADCWVNSDYWIKGMSQYFSEKDILLGLGLYQCDPNNNVELITHFETIHTALQYTSLSNIGINYMAVGRNLGYTKKIFEEASGFDSHKNILSGDDDLLVNQISNSSNTIAILDKDTITYSLPQKDWKSWFRQKTRHISASYHYKFSNKLLLGALSCSHISVYFLYLLMIPLDMANLLHLSILFLLRTMLVIICFKKFTALIDEKIKWWNIPILDLMLIAYQIIIGASSVISKRKTWI